MTIYSKDFQTSTGNRRHVLLWLLWQMSLLSQGAFLTVVNKGASGGCSAKGWGVAMARFAFRGSQWGVGRRPERLGGLVSS